MMFLRSTETPSLMARRIEYPLIVATMAGGENKAQEYASALAEQVVGDREGMTIRAGGSAMIIKQINQVTMNDLLRMEAIAVPLSFLVLVWVFGGLVAGLHRQASDSQRLGVCSGVGSFACAGMKREKNTPIS
jgi:predicted RND superfamily exporter protein